MTKHKPHIVKKWLLVFETIDNSKLSTIECCKKYNA